MALEQVLTAHILRIDNLAAPHGLKAKVAWLRKAQAIELALGERAAKICLALGGCTNLKAKADLDLQELSSIVDGLIASCS